MTAVSVTARKAGMKGDDERLRCGAEGLEQRGSGVAGGLVRERYRDAFAGVGKYEVACICCRNERSYIRNDRNI